MDKTTDSTKLTKLHELTTLLPREIRGQSHALPRITSAVRRGELGLTKPVVRAGASFCSVQLALEKRKQLSC
jgi:ATP-dependent Clp protease ATP-binding subunit ClpA